METKTLGRHIVADPAICHGEPTFRARTHASWSRMYWNRLRAAWLMRQSSKSGVTRLTSDAIAEAARMAREAPAAYAPKLVSEPVIA